MHEFDVNTGETDRAKRAKGSAGLRLVGTTEKGNLRGSFHWQIFYGRIGCEGSPLGPQPGCRVIVSLVTDDMTSSGQCMFTFEENQLLIALRVVLKICWYWEQWIACSCPDSCVRIFSETRMPFMTSTSQSYWTWGTSALWWISLVWL